MLSRQVANVNMQERKEVMLIVSPIHLVIELHEQHALPAGRPFIVIFIRNQP